MLRRLSVDSNCKGGYTCPSVWWDDDTPDELIIVGVLGVDGMVPLSEGEVAVRVRWLLRATRAGPDHWNRRLSARSRAGAAPRDPVGRVPAPSRAEPGRVSEAGGSAARHELAEGLRSLRRDAGLSTTELGRRLGWTQSKVSRVERGITLAKPEEVRQWTLLLGAEPELGTRLVDLAQELGVALTEWKKAMAPGRRRVQEEIRALEAEASTLWEFSFDVVPGLAQTAPYAEAMFRLAENLAPPGEVLAEVVAARMARQAVLADETKRFKLLFTETALRRRLISAADMRAQFTRLAEVAALPTVELGMIPFTAAETTQTYHAFAVLGDPDRDGGAVVLAETVTRGLVIRAAEEVRDYIRHHEALAGAAVHGEDLLTAIRELSAWTWG
jgi:transcriptional regulator with XRE-family HTH domain